MNKYYIFLQNYDGPKIVEFKRKEEAEDFITEIEEDEQREENSNKYSVIAVIYGEELSFHSTEVKTRYVIDKGFRHGELSVEDEVK